MKAPGHPKIYAGKAPFRLVLEIEPAEDERREVLAAKKVEPAPSARAARPVTPRPLKIVLDPGHGGKDPGAIGAGGVTEKDLVLAIARRLAQRLRKGMGATVMLTREDDRFIALEDRTAIANDEDADLFISLHINASPNPRARGLETYYLDNTDDEAAIRLAARENATSRRNISDLQFILSDLVQSSKMEDSIRLAHHLQGSMVTRVGQKYGGTVDLGVKKALFHVLVGARMPSVLVEVSFITNRIEGRNLTTPAYQETVVNALYEGIERYRASAFAARNL
jgi:N-acetylmuramoyl-L-alanine amidase